MNFSSLRIAVTACAFFAVTLSSFSQDLLCIQAPIDRKLKAVDSVSLQHLRSEQLLIGDDASELYDSWNNSYAHCYGNAALPDSFKIDLRGFAMPTPSRLVTSKYGYRPAFRRVHKGLDIKVYTGDTIYAAFDGKVRVAKFDAGGYGYYLMLRHNNGLETLYGHLSKQLVGVNDEVKAGEPIGLGGNTGRSFGSHLHFETRFLGQAIDPALLFDFPAQDVTGDFYVFHKDNPSGHTGDVASNEGANNRHKSGSKRKSSGSDSAGHYYKVKKGESLYSIAGKLGMSAEKLGRINHIKNASRIRPGQILRY